MAAKSDDVMLKVGLTGGIGSGKTTVANFFQDLGAHLIDADQIARQLTAKNQPCFDQIQQRFGKPILTKQGDINRAKLREIIFDNPEQKQWLEKLLHPLIKEQIRVESQREDLPYCIIVIPLLVETEAVDLVKRILAIETTLDNQIKRIVSRDHINKELAATIITAQVDQQVRLSIADDVIFNNSDFEELRRQVHQYHLKYLRLGEQ